MSPLNTCLKERDKIAKQLTSMRVQFDAEKAKNEALLKLAAKERLYTFMYSSMFQSVLSSIEEDVENARTAKEAREWVTELINRFKPAFNVPENEQDAPDFCASEQLGIEFNKENLHSRYIEILTDIRTKHQ
jgi:hypothetical protein